MENENVKKDRIDQVDELLSEYTEEKLLLKKIKMGDPQLDVGTNDLKKMTSEELNYWRFEVTMYLTFLQKEINKHRSRANWAANALKTYINNKAIDFDGYGMDEKRAKAMKNDTFATKLSKLSLESQATLDRLEYIPARINALTEIAKDIIWARRREDYNAEKNDE